MLTQAQLKELLIYDPDTGFITQRPRPGVAKNSTPTRGYNHGRGYRAVSVAGKPYLVHRLAFLYMTGDWPEHEIDHRDGDRSNNRWSNLRPATSGQNKCNTCTRKDNTSGVKGISWETSKSRWRAEIWHQGRKHYVGVGTDLEALAIKTETRRRELHGDYAQA